MIWTVLSWVVAGKEMQQRFKVAHALHNVFFFFLLKLLHAKCDYPFLAHDVLNPIGEYMLQRRTECGLKWWNVLEPATNERVLWQFTPIWSSFHYHDHYRLQLSVWPIASTYRPDDEEKKKERRWWTLSAIAICSMLFDMHVCIFYTEYLSLWNLNTIWTNLI